MFRVTQHPSSRLLKTVTAASGTGHNIGPATSFQRGQDPTWPRWKSKPLLTAVRMSLHRFVLNPRVQVTNNLSVIPHRLSARNIQSNCNKHTCLQSLSATVFSAILLCCELCQAVQVHRRYTDPLRLYRHGFDITEYTAFPNYTHRQGLKL